MATNTIDDTGLKYVYEKLDNKKVEKVDGKGLSTNDYTTDEKNKLAGISVNANKVEASETNGNIKIDSTETPVYDDTELQAKTSILTETAQGNPISFTTLSAQNSGATEVGIEPIQDLHGYDKPWVGGAGKNLLPMTVDGIKAANTSGTWSGNTYTLNDEITFAILTDDANNVVGININGTPTATRSFYFETPNGLSLQVQDYIINGLTVAGSNSTFRFILTNANHSQAMGYCTGVAGQTISITTADNYGLQITCYSGYTFSNMKIYPMIRLSTVSDATFEPYTNFCPIFSGVYSKNLLPLTVQAIKDANTSGTWNGNEYTYDGMSYTILTDANNNVTGIQLKRNSTGSTYAQFKINYLINAGNYIVNSNGLNGSSSLYIEFRDQDNERVNTYGEDATLNLLSQTDKFARIIIGASYDPNNIIVKPMLRNASISDATFEPYDTHKIEILGCGKNLVEDKIEHSAIVSNGQIQGNSSTMTTMWLARVKKNSVYVVTSDESLICGFFYSKPEYNSVSYNNSRRVSPTMYFTAPIDGWVAFRSTFDYNKPQLELGQTATDYEPYQSSNNILLEVGQNVYGGKFIPETGVLTVTYKILDMGDLTWSKSANVNLFSTNISDGKRATATDVPSAFITDLYEVKNTGTSSSYSDLDKFAYQRITNNNYMIVSIKDNNYTDDITFTNAMDGRQICYELENPIEIQLTPQQIALLKGYNYLSTNCQNLKLTYRTGQMATLGDVLNLENKLEDEILDSTILTDTVTGDKYKLVVTSGVLSIEQISD